METYAIKEPRSFSSNRFTSLMKADLAVNKSNYIKLFIGGSGIFIALALLVSVIALIAINGVKNNFAMYPELIDGAIKGHQQTYGTAYTAISVWVFSIGLTVLGSLTFSNLSSKKKRISALMIPASKAEKFILNVLVYLIGGTIALLIGFFIGLGVCQIIFGGGEVTYDNVYSFFFNESASGTIITAFILWALLGNSIFALGSSLWPKLSWIKTWVVTMVVQWIGTIAMIILSTADISWYSFFMFWDGHLSLLKWTGISVLAILNIVCWVLAWWRYRNVQIIQRFMTK